MFSAGEPPYLTRNKHALSQTDAAIIAALHGAWDRMMHEN
jgi:hypothetical protein